MNITLGQMAYERLMELITERHPDLMANSEPPEAWGELDEAEKGIFEELAEAIGLEYAERKDLHG